MYKQYTESSPDDAADQEWDIDVYENFCALRCQQFSDGLVWFLHKNPWMCGAVQLAQQYDFLHYGLNHLMTRVLSVIKSTVHKIDMHTCWDGFTKSTMKSL